MDIDLSKLKLFDGEDINLDKNINFVFGKNGTGKSTLANAIQEQCADNFDIRLFQGFTSMIGEQHKLNAVLLGEENKNINIQIEKLNSDKQGILTKINQSNTEISETGKNNLLSEYKKASELKNKKDKEIERFYADSAREIVQDPNLVDNARTYNKNSFKKEIVNRKLLDNARVQQLINIIRADKKNTLPIPFEGLKIDGYLESVNEILAYKVVAKSIIPEFQDNPDKVVFAQTGLRIHQPGELCAFCGSVIKNTRLNELKQYFSASEVEQLTKRINDGKEKIIKKLDTVSKIRLNPTEFYPLYHDSAKTIADNIRDKCLETTTFLRNLKVGLEEKEGHLFDSVDELTILPPEMIDESEYNDLMNKNKKFGDTLLANQKKAQADLRYNRICLQVQKFGLDKEQLELNSLSEKEQDALAEVELKKEYIENLQKDADIVDTHIESLLQQTRNTKKLADNINKKLQTIVSFQLERVAIDSQEFYEIKDDITGTRDIRKLSTGEKNIIGFLYFVEKLNEIGTGEIARPKLIIFDDPMNSNDDTMQYLIIDELQKLIKRCVRKDCQDIFVLMTHNIFFYLNCSFDIKRQRSDRVDPFVENNFYRLLSDHVHTKISKITNKNEDFKTSYDALWFELLFLYQENKPEMMLNPIRRIIETYVNFNGQEDFYKTHKDAKNLFNSNSHYLSDFEADLNGKTREEIKELMRVCFNDNKAISHFNKHWSNAAKSYASHKN